MNIGGRIRRMARLACVGSALEPHTPEGSSAGEEIGRCTMIVLVSSSLCREEISGRNGQGRDKLYRRVWRRIVNWLLAPTPFPGQWPQNERQAER